MATIDYVHACNHAFLNEQRQPCLIGLLSDLFAPAFPYHRASLTIAAQIKAETQNSVNRGDRQFN